MLNNLVFEQQVTRPTRKVDKIIYHIFSRTPSKIVYTNVIPYPTISDHDDPHFIAKVSANNFQPPFKCIRIFKNFEMNVFISDFKTYQYNQYTASMKHKVN